MSLHVGLLSLRSLSARCLRLSSLSSVTQRCSGGMKERHIAIERNAAQLPPHGRQTDSARAQRKETVGQAAAGGNEGGGGEERGEVHTKQRATATARLCALAKAAVAGSARRRGTATRRTSAQKDKPISAMRA